MRYPSSDLLWLPLISTVSPGLRMKRGPVDMYHHTCAVIFLMLWKHFPTSILSQRWGKWNATGDYFLCLHIFYDILSVSSLLYFLNEDVSVFFSYRAKLSGWLRLFIMKTIKIFLKVYVHFYVWASLVDQWLRVRSLALEELTCCRKTKPMNHSWSHAP